MRLPTSHEMEPANVPCPDLVLSVVASVFISGKAFAKKKPGFTFIQAKNNRREIQTYGLKSNLMTTLDSSAAGSYFHFTTAAITA
jgi:hypothetical protein